MSVTRPRVDTETVDALNNWIEANSDVPHTALTFDTKVRLMIDAARGTPTDSRTTSGGQPTLSDLDPSAIRFD